jgi:hypothetical protein
MFNFKLSKHLNVSGVNSSNEWKTEKRHEGTNIGQLRTTQIMAAVRYVTSFHELQVFRLLDFCWTECTSNWYWSILSHALNFTSAFFLGMLILLM